MKFIRENAKEHEEVYLFCIGDLHLGAKTADVNLFKKYVDLASKIKNSKIVLMGDIVEMAGRNSPGGSLFEQAKTPDEQIDWMIEIFEPLNDKIITTVAGNHEKRISNQSGVDIMKQMARTIKVDYTPRSGVIRLNLKERAYSIFVTHGAGSGKTPALKLRRLREAAAVVHNCDVYLMGHHHANIYEVMQVKEPDVRMKKVVSRDVLLQITGAFLGYDESYAEEVLMVPTPIGAPIIKLNSKGFRSMKYDEVYEEVNRKA